MKMYRPKDPPPSLPADQLHQMFPTPPSHEHPSIHSPADIQDHDIHYASEQVQSISHHKSSDPFLKCLIRDLF